MYYKITETASLVLFTVRIHDRREESQEII